MPLYRNENKILLFVHIPKTGGSTIENTLKGEGIPQALHSRVRLGEKAVTPQHMHREVIQAWIPASFYDAAFCVVRNPFARIASEYKWQKQARKAQVSNFDTWVNNQLERHQENEYLGDNHIRPQSDFVWDGLKVFHLENGLEKPLKFSMRKLGLDPKRIRAKDVRKDAKTKSVLLGVKEGTLDNLRTFYRSDFDKFGYSDQDGVEEIFRFI